MNASGGGASGRTAVEASSSPSVHLQHFEDFDTFSALWVIGVFP